MNRAKGGGKKRKKEAIVFKLDILLKCFFSSFIRSASLFPQSTPLVVGGKDYSTHPCNCQHTPKPYIYGLNIFLFNLCLKKRKRAAATRNKLPVLRVQVHKLLVTMPLQEAIITSPKKKKSGF